MLIRIGAASAAIFSVFLVVACGNEAKSGFMDGCTNSGVAKAVCLCTYGKLEADFDLMKKNPSFAFSTAFKQHQVNAMQACQKES